jgi:OOP family OmpA-OmpF porin
MQLFKNALQLTSVVGMLFCIAPTSAQNLVPNPSFEEYSFLPTNDLGAMRCVNEWTTPNGTNGDYFHPDARGKHYGVPNNQYGRTAAHSGKAYAGICIGDGISEYLQNELTETLVKGAVYRVEFFVCKSKLKRGTVNNLGVLLVDKILLTGPMGGIVAKPQISFKEPDGFKETDWIKLSYDFTAEGGEKTVIIGSFLERGGVEVKKYSHYHIDDVSVVRLTPAAVEAVIEVPEPAEEPVFHSEEIAVGNSISLSNIYFETGKSELLPTSHAELDQLVALLTERPTIEIEIVGHTDNTGSEQANLKLSAERAKSVLHYLTAQNIAAARLSAEGQGSSHPLFPNDSEEDREKNRRVEFVILRD